MIFKVLVIISLLLAVVSTVLQFSTIFNPDHVVYVTVGIYLLIAAIFVWDEKRQAKKEWEDLFNEN